MISIAFLTALVLSVGVELPSDPTARQAKATEYAEDIAAAVGDDVELAKMTVATIGGESRFNPRIARCRCRPNECDGGRATGLGQLHPHWFRGRRKAEICASNRLSMTLVAHALTVLRERYGVQGALRWYIGCRSPKDRRVVQRWALFAKVNAVREEA